MQDSTFMRSAVDFAAFHDAIPLISRTILAAMLMSHA